jgi:hypothetical protein
MWLYTTFGSCQIASRTCCSAFRIYSNSLGMSKRQRPIQAKQSDVEAFEDLRGLGCRLVGAIISLLPRHWMRTTPWRDRNLVQGRHFAQSVPALQPPRYEKQSTQHGGMLYWLAYTLWEIDICRATCSLSGPHHIDGTV